MRVQLIRAWPHRHEITEVDVPDHARVADAVRAAGWQTDAEVTGYAVFGVACAADAPLREGDRVELLRALVVDPKEARRLRARK